MQEGLLTRSCSEAQPLSPPIRLPSVTGPIQLEARRQRALVT